MTNNPIDKIVNNITTDVGRKVKKALEYAGEKICSDFADMARSALDAYYDEYTPNFYDRTYSLKNDSYIKVNQRKGYQVRAGIRFEPDMMTHPKAGIPEGAIFENFAYGIHGNENVYHGVEHRAYMDMYYSMYLSQNTPFELFQEGMEMQR